MASVSLSLLARGDRMSDQAEVWDGIAEKSNRMNVSSQTNAMDAIFSTHADSLEDFVTGCQPVDGQVGALFAVNGALVGFDLFDQPSTLRKILPKLVRSVAVDAIDAADVADDSAPASLTARAVQFIAVAANAPQHRAPAVGMGEDVRLTAPRIAGAALAVDDHVVHVSALSL